MITEQDVYFRGKRNEINPSLLGNLVLNPFYAYSSSSRMYMCNGHISSSVPLIGATKKSINTLYEREYGKYTFSIIAPEDLTVIDVIHRYDHRYGKGALPQNSQSFLIYFENNNPKNIGCLELPSFFSMHKDFGFKYVPKKNFSKGDTYFKGEILADSPNVDSDGDWNFSREVPTALMSVPGIIQDGFIVSESLCKEMATTVIGRRFIEYGEDEIPLMIYNGKSFPDIGECIRPDGLLFAKRKLSNKMLNGDNEIDFSLAPLKMSPKSLKSENRDMFYDDPVYGRPGARIIDVRVHCSPNSKNKTLTGMETQSENYAVQSYEFYKKIYDRFDAIRKERNRLNQRMEVLPSFYNLLMEAQAEIANYEAIKTKKISKAYKSEPIGDRYLIEIVFEDRNVPLTIGSKITGLHGNKGVVCGIWPDHHMPLDKKGNRCHLIGDGDSVLKRTNTGVLWEQCYNAFRREMVETIRGHMGLDIKNPGRKELLQAKFNNAGLDVCWDYVQAFIVKASPLMYDQLMASIDDKLFTPHEFVLDILENDMRTYWPQDTLKSWPEIIRDLREYFPITFDTVEYVDVNGDIVETKDPVLIGDMSIVRLDKLGEDWAGVNSPKMSAHGTPSKLTANDKYSNPGRNQSTRFWGESEVRLGDAYAGPDPVAEQIDRSNNATKHEQIIRNIFNAPDPMSILTVVGCKEYPRGESKPLQFVHAMTNCAGFKFSRSFID